MEEVTKYLSSWTPTSVPTSTTLSSIASTHVPDLYRTMSSVYSRALTERDYVNLRSLSQIFRGAQASLTIISAEDVLATATDPGVQAKATEEIFYATLNLKNLAYLKNLYKYYLSRPANIIYLVVYFLLFAYFTLMSLKSRYWWYNITFVCGYGLEFIGFLGRVLAFTDDTRMQFYLMQIVCLTISPAFIMAGVYFLFGQLVVIHGREYSRLKPLWYSYFFIATDVISLIIQAGGGGSASVASNNHTNTKPGTNTMIAGIAAQVFAMTVFLVFWFEFLYRIYFKNAAAEPTDNPLAKKSVVNYFKFLLNEKSVREYRHTQLERYYNKKFYLIRQRQLFDYLPLAMTCAVIVIYIRCIYRVVELAEGFGGYLYSNEPYLMVLDACMIAIAGIIFVPFHPYWVFGKENVVRLATIKKNQDEHHEENKISEQVGEDNSKE